MIKQDLIFKLNTIFCLNSYGIMAPSGGFRGGVPPPLFRNPNLCTVQKCAIILL